MSVYFISDEARTRMKIGFTNESTALLRLEALQLKSAERLVIVRFIADADMSVERQLHRHYAPLRIKGEWFEYCKTMLTITPPPPLPRLRNGTMTFRVTNQEYENLAACAKETGRTHTSILREFIRSLAEPPDARANPGINDHDAR